MVSGSEMILNKILSSARKLMILGMVLLLVPLFIILAFVFYSGSGIELPVYIGISTVFIFGVFLFVYNLLICMNPSSSRVIKKNPLVLSMADELMESKIYQDNFLIFSPRIIANVNDLTQISFTDEVFLIYVYIHRTNSIVDQKQLVLENARNTIRLNIFAKKDPEINELINNIVSHCRYARVGYSPESLAYLDNMRKLWREDQARKNTSNISR